MNEQQIAAAKAQINAALQLWLEELMKYRSDESPNLQKTKRQRENVIRTMQAAESTALFGKAINGPIAR